MCRVHTPYEYFAESGLPGLLLFGRFVPACACTYWAFMAAARAQKGFFQLQIPTFGGLFLVGTYFGWNIGVWSIAANTALLQQYNNTANMKPLSIGTLSASNMFHFLALFKDFIVQK